MSKVCCLIARLFPEPKDLAYHQDNPDYADGTWQFVAITLSDISEIRVRLPGPIQRFFRWLNGSIQVIR